MELSFQYGEFLSAYYLFKQSDRLWSLSIRKVKNGKLQASQRAHCLVSQVSGDSVVKSTRSEVTYFTKKNFKCYLSVQQPKLGPQKNPPFEVIDVMRVEVSPNELYNGSPGGNFWIGIGKGCVLTQMSALHLRFSYFLDQVVGCWNIRLTWISIHSYW